MSSAAITFDEMERKSEQTKGWALLAKTAGSVVQAAVLMSFTCRALRRLVDSLTAERLEQLTPESTVQLTHDLQELHCLLAGFCRSRQSDELRSIKVFGSLVRKVQESTEDLGDIIDDLVLSENEEFKQLVSQCAEDVSAVARSGRV